MLCIKRIENIATDLNTLINVHCTNLEQGPSNKWCPQHRLSNRWCPPMLLLSRILMLACKYVYIKIGRSCWWIESLMTSTFTRQICGKMKDS